MTIHTIQLAIFNIDKQWVYINIEEYKNKASLDLRLKEIRKGIKTARLDYQINVSSSQLIKQ